MLTFGQNSVVFNPNFSFCRHVRNAVPLKPCTNTMSRAGLTWPFGRCNSYISGESSYELASIECKLFTQILCAKMDSSSYIGLRIIEERICRSSKTITNLWLGNRRKVARFKSKVWGKWRFQNTLIGTFMRILGINIFKINHLACRFLF